MKRISALFVVVLLFIIYSCNEVEEAVFKDVKGVYKGVAKAYLTITIDISKQDKDKLEGMVKFEVNKEKLPEGDTLIKYLPTEDSVIKGEIALSHIVLATTEYKVTVDSKEVPVSIVFEFTRSEDGKKLLGNMTFSGVSDLGEIPVELTKQ